MVAAVVCTGSEAEPSAYPSKVQSQSTACMLSRQAYKVR